MDVGDSNPLQPVPSGGGKCSRKAMTGPLACNKKGLSDDHSKPKHNSGHLNTSTVNTGTTTIVTETTLLDINIDNFCSEEEKCVCGMNYSGPNCMVSFCFNASFSFLYFNFICLFSLPVDTMILHTHMLYHR